MNVLAFIRWKEKRWKWPQWYTIFFQYCTIFFHLIWFVKLYSSYYWLCKMWCMFEHMARYLTLFVMWHSDVVYFHILRYSIFYMFENLNLCVQYIEYRELVNLVIWSRLRMCDLNFRCAFLIGCFSAKLHLETSEKRLKNEAHYHKAVFIFEHKYIKSFLFSNRREWWCVAENL